MDRIKCVGCKHDSYNDYGKTKLYCCTCYDALKEELATVKKERDEYKGKLANGVSEREHGLVLDCMKLQAENKSLREEIDHLLDNIAGLHIISDGRFNRLKSLANDKRGTINKSIKKEVE